MDISNGILIEADNNMIKVTAVSMYIIVQTKFTGKILRDRYVTLDGKLLLNLIRNINGNSEIDIKSSEIITTIECNDLTFDIKSKEVNIYPSMEKNKGEDLFYMV